MNRSLILKSRTVWRLQRPRHDPGSERARSRARARRPASLRRLPEGRGLGPRRSRHHGPLDRRAEPHSPPRVRRPPSRRRGRNHDHRLAQSTGVQRLQSLLGERRPDRSSRGRGDRRSHHRGAGRFPDPEGRILPSRATSALRSTSLTLRRSPHEQRRSRPANRLYRPPRLRAAPLSGGGEAERVRQAIFPVSEQGQPDPAFPTGGLSQSRGARALSTCLLSTAKRERLRRRAGARSGRRSAGAVVRRGPADLRRPQRQRARRPPRSPRPRAHPGDEAVSWSRPSSRRGCSRRWRRPCGVRYLDTLTGFKWIANEAMRVESEEGVRFVFGYEEALGYTVGTVVRDKDGIGAGLALAEMASELRARGVTLLDALAELRRVTVTSRAGSGTSLSKEPKARAGSSRRWTA